MNEILSKEYARWLNGWKAPPPPTPKRVFFSDSCAGGYHRMYLKANLASIPKPEWEWVCKDCGITQKEFIAQTKRDRVSYDN